MNAARYIGNGALEVVDTEAPQPSPGEVQLEVAYTGVCGSSANGRARFSENSHIPRL
jgi:D-arabinose 1-dehydrogenase-like Zn-dependent alcohol dehydrogenase